MGETQEAADLDVIWSLLMELAERLDAMPMNAHVGCWQCDLDGHWQIAINGHVAPVRWDDGTEIPPHHVYVRFNGWPAGMLNPFEATIAAGAVANVGTFLAALRARIAAGR